MDASSTCWTAVAQTPYPWEREVVDFVNARLTAPDEGAEVLEMLPLGTPAHHLFGGRPPEAGGVELRARLPQPGGLDPAGGARGTSERLRMQGLNAAAPEADRRTARVADVLVGLDGFSGLSQCRALPRLKLGGQWRFDRESLDRWIGEQKASAGSWRGEDRDAR